jgi:RNA polymerase sigma factor (sigma-70 family)
MELKNDYNGIDPFIRRLVRRKAFGLSHNPVFRDMDRKDIEQELMILILSKMEGHDPKRSKLATYAIRIAENHIASLIREREAKKRCHGMIEASLDECVPDEDGEMVHLHETMDREEVLCRCGRCGCDEVESLRFAMDVRAVVDGLPHDLRETCRLYLIWGDLDTVARKLGVVRSTVYRRMERACPYFRDAGLENYFSK